MASTTPNFASLFQYSLIALPLAFAGLPLYIHMPDFYIREFGVGIGVLGIVLLIIRLIDAVQDPLIGYIADRHPQKRSLLVYTGFGCLTLGMIGLSLGPPGGNATVFWFAVFMVLATTGLSIIVINMNMLGGFWVQEAHQRIKVASWREGLGLVGLLIAALLPTLLQSHLSDKARFAVLLLLFGALFIPACLLFHQFIKGLQDSRSSAVVAHTPVFALRTILTGEEKLFLLICFLSYFAASIPAVLVLFFIRDYLEAEALAGLFLTLYFLSGALCIGLWSRVARRYCPYKVWMLVMIVSVMTFFGAVLLSPGDSVAYGLICILSGITLGAEITLPPALIAGRIQARGQENQATQYYAALAFLPKVALALAAGLALLVLDRFGFQPGMGNSEVALHALVLIYALVPCLIKGVSAIMLWRLIKTEGENGEIAQRTMDHGNTRIS